MTCLGSCSLMCGRGRVTGCMHAGSRNKGCGCEYFLCELWLDLSLLVKFLYLWQLYLGHWVRPGTWGMGVVSDQYLGIKAATILSISWSTRMPSYDNNSAAFLAFIKDMVAKLINFLSALIAISELCSSSTSWLWGWLGSPRGQWGQFITISVVVVITGAPANNKDAS